MLELGEPARERAAAASRFPLPGPPLPTSSTHDASRTVLRLSRTLVAPEVRVARRTLRHQPTPSIGSLCANRELQPASSGALSPISFPQRLCEKAAAPQFDQCLSSP